MAIFVCFFGGGFSGVVGVLCGQRASSWASPISSEPETRRGAPKQTRRKKDWTNSAVLLKGLYFRGKGRKDGIVVDSVRMAMWDSTGGTDKRHNAALGYGLWELFTENGGQSCKSMSVTVAFGAALQGNASLLGFTLMAVTASGECWDPLRYPSPRYFGSCSVDVQCVSWRWFSSHNCAKQKSSVMLVFAMCGLSSLWSKVGAVGNTLR